MHCRNGFSTFQDVTSWILNKHPDIFPKEAPLIILDSKYAACMDKNVQDANHTSHITRSVHFVRNGENSKMSKIDWCEGGMQLADIATKNFDENNLNPRVKYFMVVIYN